MNILVIGGKLLGRSIAEDLDFEGHDVSIIDAAEENLEKLDPEFSGAYFVGFPMDLEALTNAGIESCDAVVVATGDDNLNITVGQIAKNYFKIPRVVARISDPYRESIFEKFGLKTVCPTNLTTKIIIDSIVNKNAPKQISFGTNTVSFVTKPIKKDYIGYKLNSILLNESDEDIFALSKANGNLMLLSEARDSIIEEGDNLIYYKKID